MADLTGVNLLRGPPAARCSTWTAAGAPPGPRRAGPRRHRAGGGVGVPATARRAGLQRLAGAGHGLQLLARPRRRGAAGSTEPATGKAFARVGLGEAATWPRRPSGEAGEPGWAAPPGPQRAALIRRAGRILECPSEFSAGWSAKGVPARARPGSRWTWCSASCGRPRRCPASHGAICCRPARPEGRA